MANRINGMYEVGPLGAFIGGGTRQVQPLLDMMEGAGLIKMSGGKITVPHTQITD